MAGLTSAGFVPKTLAEILEEIETAQKDVLGADLNVGADTVLGQLNGIVSSKLAELWELAQAVHASAYPDGASGISLDRLGALTGADRLVATSTLVTVTCTGTNGTLLPAGRQVSTAAGDVFESLEAATIPVGLSVDVVFQAVETGPIIANAGTVTTIVTPVAGWASCTNAADADTLGTNIETDASFRVRRAALLALGGDATEDAIRSEILDVVGVSDVRVHVNETDDTDADGVPAHAIECVVVGGDDQDIVDAIFNSKAAGILAYGTTVGAAVDGQGDSHVVSFTRPTELVVEVSIAVTTDPATFPTTGEQQIKDALAALIATYVVGQDVVRNKLFAPIFGITGVIDVSTLEICFTGDALDDVTLEVGSREIATLDSSDVTVVTS